MNDPAQILSIAPIVLLCLGVILTMTYLRLALAQRDINRLERRMRELDSLDAHRTLMTAKGLDHLHQRIIDLENTACRKQNDRTATTPLIH
jgi:hypothetical protein